MNYGLVSLKNGKYCEIKPAYLQLKMTFCGFFHSKVVSTKEELRNSSQVNTTHITWKKSIFCRIFNTFSFYSLHSVPLTPVPPSKVVGL